VRPDSQSPAVLNSHVALKDVAKAYGKGNKAISALEGVTLDISRGEFLSILGPVDAVKARCL